MTGQLFDLVCCFALAWLLLSFLFNNEIPPFVTFSFHCSVLPESVISSLWSLKKKIVFDCFSFSPSFVKFSSSFFFFVFWHDDAVDCASDEAFALASQFFFSFSCFTRFLTQLLLKCSFQLTCIRIYVSGQKSRPLFSFWCFFFLSLSGRNCQGRMCALPICSFFFLVCFEQEERAKKG